MIFFSRLTSSHLSPVIGHMSFIMRHLSHVSCHMAFFFFLLFLKILKLFGGGSVISRADLVYFYHIHQNISLFQVKVSSFWSWLFTLSKIPELGDTLFIVLRKQQLIFLHWSVMIVQQQQQQEVYSLAVKKLGGYRITSTSRPHMKLELLVLPVHVMISVQLAFHMHKA